MKKGPPTMPKEEISLLISWHDAKFAIRKLTAAFLGGYLEALRYFAAEAHDIVDIIDPSK